METQTLNGLGILVTGGGTGIGKACATGLVEHGATVTICGRTENTLVSAVDEIADQGGTGSIHHVVCDVSDEAQVAETMAVAAEPTGNLHGVIANAGGGGALVPYHLQDVVEFERVLRQNVIGTMLCVKHAVPRLKAAGGGSFVGLSSLAGSTTHPFFGAYPVAKAGIESIIRNAADEFGAAGIRFNAIQPGFIATELMAAVPRDSAVYASYVDNTPMADVGQPDDVARLARFLIGPESRWITGQCIAVDGGHHLRRGPQFGEFLAQLGDDVLSGDLPG